MAVKVEVHFKGGSVMEVECEDFETFQGGPVHKVSGLSFKESEEARQYVPYLDFEEVVAFKVTDLGDGGEEQN